MCMQTKFGCCLIDGKVIEKNVKLKPTKLAKNEKLKNKKRKTIYQVKVEFE
ncbi:hypothetical protein JCM11957_01130 [Caminibacter profundus]